MLVEVFEEYLLLCWLKVDILSRRVGDHSQLVSFFNELEVEIEAVGCVMKHPW